MKKLFSYFFIIAMVAMSACSDDKDSDDVNIEVPKENIVYSFDVEKADLLDKYKVTINLLGEGSGKDFVALEDLTLPFTFDEKSTAVLGTHFEVVGGANEFAIAKGTNKTTVVLSSKEVELGEEAVAIMKVDSEKADKRFIEGNNSDIKITVKGAFKLSSIVGKWEFVQVPEAETWLEWIADGGDDPTLVPFNNEGYIIEFAETEDGEFKLVPGDKTGDLSAFLKESFINLSAPKNTILEADIISDYCTIESFMWTSEIIQLTYFSLSNTNRAFSKDKETLGAATIAMRVNSDNNLEIHLRDYNEPPFMEEWWNYKPEFDTDMFGFCYEFKKIKE